MMELSLSQVVLLIIGTVSIIFNKPLGHMTREFQHTLTSIDYGEWMCRIPYIVIGVLILAIGISEMLSI